MELGSSIDNKVIEDKIAQLNPGHCASIIYTVRNIRINTHQYYYYYRHRRCSIAIDWYLLRLSLLTCTCGSSTRSFISFTGAYS